ncbi:MAG: ATP-binding protein [Roseobacter sp.]|jgi:chemotaxis family two-component system sensor kinase Cph1|nr:ATP-binding protein [Roseobacter sp.]
MHQSLPKMPNGYTSGTPCIQTGKASHVAGTIQNAGALLVLDLDGSQVLGASENLDTILGVSPAQAVGKSLDHTCLHIADELSYLNLRPGRLPQILNYTHENNGVPYDLTAHIQGDHRFVEFVPNGKPSSSDIRRHMRECSTACAQIISAEGFSHASQIAADAVRAITGFDRVSILRILSDRSGAIEAEAKNEEMASHLGMHLRINDMPARACETMRLAPYRAIATVSDNNVAIRTVTGACRRLDQTWSALRPASALQIAYLRNRGVSATFSYALKCQKRLWGIIECQNRAEAVVPVGNWALLHQVAVALMIKKQQEENLAKASMVTAMRRVEKAVTSETPGESDIVKAVALVGPALQNGLRANGFAFQCGQRIHRVGVTPRDETIRQIMMWACRRKADRDQFHTTSLQNAGFYSEFPDAFRDNQAACGVMIQPIALQRLGHFIWFRGPIAHQVNGRHADSTPWEASELKAAHLIFENFSGNTASHIALRAENEALRQFAHTAAHDIRAPLRGIKMALDWMAEDGFDEARVREHHEIASTSAVRLQAFTEALIELSLLSEQKPEFHPVDLDVVIRNVRDLVAVDLRASGGRLSTGPLPRLKGNQVLLTRLFLNLTSNALKYSRKDAAPVIDIRQTADKPLTVAVCDNGVGIARKHAETVFEPTRRLVHADEVTGNGLGLAIARQIMELHGGNIRLDIDHQPGARFIVEFPLNHLGDGLLQ